MKTQFSYQMTLTESELISLKMVVEQGLVDYSREIGDERVEQASPTSHIGLLKSMGESLRKAFHGSHTDQISCKAVR